MDEIDDILFAMGGTGSTHDDNNNNNSVLENENENDYDSSADREDDDNIKRKVNVDEINQIFNLDVKPTKEIFSIKNKNKLIIENKIPDPATEIERWNGIRDLSTIYIDMVKSHNLDMKMPPFERWIINNKHVDPILPDQECETDELLAKEIMEAGGTVEAAARICSDLGKSSMRIARNIRKEPSRNIKKRPKITKENNEEKKKFTFTMKGVMMTLNYTHYSKLKFLFIKNNKTIMKKDNWEYIFQQSIYSLLVRYSSLCGGTSGGGGFQGAINNEVFDVLLKHFDCRFECFASPLNCRYRNFCSAFEDIDTVFGSLGSFFNFRPTSGCYEANPPFVPSLVIEMTEHMETLLSESDEPLCFIVIIPAWSKEKNTRIVQQASGVGWRMLKKSRFCQKHILLNGREHGYCEGSQHMRPTRFKTSPFDTSTFILQNKAGRKKYKLTDEICSDIVNAFTSKHLQEFEQRNNNNKVEGGKNEEIISTEISIKKKKRKREEENENRLGITEEGKPNSDSTKMMIKKKKKKKKIKKV